MSKTFMIRHLDRIDGDDCSIQEMKIWNSTHRKDAMFKIVRGASAREMYFTDDGFAMGIAYCLAILKQTKKFESLNWQESVRTYQIKDMNKIQEQQKIRYF